MLYILSVRRSEVPTVQFCDTLIFWGQAVLAACLNADLEMTTPCRLATERSASVAPYRCDGHTFNVFFQLAC
jgi:hypothetical protein